MRTSNPALRESVFDGQPHVGYDGMTMSGTVTKTMILLAIVVGVAAFTWWQTMSGLQAIAAGVTEMAGRTRSLDAVPPLVFGYLIVGSLGGLVLALVTIFKPTASPITTPIYAAFEGIFLGALSAMFEYMYPGIAMQAVLVTFSILFGMLALYRLGLVRATEKFRMAVVSATLAIVLVYLATIVLRFFGMEIPYIHGTGMVGIGFSIFVVVIASLNFILDFDFIERGSEAGLPRYMEWYGAFGLLVTLVWLYIEILRLLSKLRSRN